MKKKNKNIYNYYMSLASILQGYSNDLTAKENHNTENEQDISNRKATTIEQQFQNHIDHITSGAADLGGASSAFHLGRKVYKAYRAAGTALETKKAELAKAKGDEPSGEEGEAVKQNPQGNPDPVKNAGGESAVDSAPTIRSNEVPFPEVEPTSQTGASVTSSNTGASAGQTSAPSQAAQADVSAEADSSQARVVPQQTQAQVQSTDVKGDLDESPLDQPRSIQQSGHINPNQGGGGKPAEPAPASEPKAETTSVDSQVGKQASNPADMSSIGADSENVIKSGVQDEAGNMAKQVGGKLASGMTKSAVSEGASTALDSGLITTDAVLDSIPVVGEVASVITGLIGLFEGIGHKNDPDKEVSPTGAPAQASVGIDPNAVMKAQAPTTTATIV
jgi:hypothetical protein